MTQIQYNNVGKSKYADDKLKKKIFALLTSNRIIAKKVNLVRRYSMEILFYFI